LLAKKIDVLSIAGGQRITKEEIVAAETHLQVVLNASIVGDLRCSPELEKELAIGYLVTGGFISGLEDVEMTRTSEASCWVTTKRASYRKEVQKRASARTVPFSQVRDSVGAMVQGQSIHKATGGTHAAALHNPDTGQMFASEDMSRTSALLKAVGAAVLHGINLTEVFAVTTGRLTAETVVRCAGAGIPMLASRTVATDEAVRRATERNLTLIGAVRNDQAWLYNEGVWAVDHHV
jgi:formate dehydrogenase assembly factor FdhD